MSYRCRPHEQPTHKLPQPEQWPYLHTACISPFSGASPTFNHLQALVVSTRQGRLPALAPAQPQRARHAAPAPHYAGSAQLPPASLGMLLWHRAHLYQPVVSMSQQSVLQHTAQGITHLSPRLVVPALAGSPSAEGLTDCPSTHQTTAGHKACCSDLLAELCSATTGSRLHCVAALLCAASSQHLGALLCSGGLPAPLGLQSAGVPEPEPA